MFVMYVGQVQKKKNRSGRGKKPPIHTDKHCKHCKQLRDDRDPLLPAREWIP